MVGRYCAIALMVIALPNTVGAGYLDDNPDEMFAAVYERLGALPVRAARDPFVWLRLEELKREPCDQKSIGDLALMLDKLGYRREAADGLFRFVKDCGAPLSALNQSVGIYLKLTDYPRAVEVADEFVRRSPSDRNARYLRGVALRGAGDFQRALVDYADPANRDTIRTQKIISDYEAKGTCVISKEFVKESYPLRGQKAS
jgi:aspartyl protease family protein